MRGEKEFRGAQEVQGNEEVPEQRRRSNGNGIGSSNPTGKGESQQDPGEKGIHIILSIPHPPGMEGHHGQGNQELEFEGDGREK